MSPLCMQDIDIFMKVGLSALFLLAILLLYLDQSGQQPDTGSVFSNVYHSFKKCETMLFCFGSVSIHCVPIIALGQWV